MFLLFYKEVTNLHVQIKWVNVSSSIFFCFLILYLRNVSLIAFISLTTTFIGTLSSYDVVEHDNPIRKTDIKQSFILLLTLTCWSSIIALSSMSFLCLSSLTSSSYSRKNISRSNISTTCSGKAIVVNLWMLKPSLKISSICLFPVNNSNKSIP